MNYPLQSERVVVSAPMSFTGSAKRIWKLTYDTTGVTQALAATLAVILILMAWSLILVWYGFFGLLVVPYRVLRRSQRRKKIDVLRHRESLQAMQLMQQQQMMQTAYLAQQQTAALAQQQPRAITQPTYRQLPPPPPPAAP